MSDDIWPPVYIGMRNRALKRRDPIEGGFSDLVISFRGSLASGETYCCLSAVVTEQPRCVSNSGFDYVLESHPQLHVIDLAYFRLSAHVELLSTSLRRKRGD